jgi:hypothetical protein
VRFLAKVARRTGWSRSFFTKRYASVEATVFLILMVVGLVGLVVMAIPAFAHGHALSGHGLAQGTGHGVAGHGVAGHGVAGHAGVRAGAVTHDGVRGAAQLLIPADPAHQSGWRFLPSPRAVFSVLALYGAFGNAAVRAVHLSPVPAALLAMLPALLVEWALVRPLWNLVFRFQASESTPLEQLALNAAEAVVPFRNGRGIISTVRDGRRVQLSACLRSDQSTLPVRVGDRLLIEDVDAAKERVTVSVLQE